MKTRILLIGVILLGWAACAEATVIYDVADDFSATNNPNGAWSYGYYPAPDGDPRDFVKYDYPQKVARDNGSLTDLDGWTWTGTWNFPNAIHNGKSYAVTEFGITWEPNAFTLFSNDNSRGIAAFQWTAPNDGTIDVTATLTSITGETPAAYIDHIRSASYDRLVGGQALAPFVPYVWTTSGLGVLKGDHLSFAIVSPSITQIETAIAFTPVPEPTTLVLLTIALSGILAYAWRSQK